MQKMTYVTQLEEYEEEVMKKRLEEMPEEEVQRLLRESESDKEKIRARQASRGSEGGNS
jgi:5'-deoxynucleotidase YfbR-like HD superfamily hydrolase